MFNYNAMRSAASKYHSVSGEVKKKHMSVLAYLVKHRSNKVSILYILFHLTTSKRSWLKNVICLHFSFNLGEIKLFSRNSIFILFYFRKIKILMISFQLNVMLMMWCLVMTFLYLRWTLFYEFYSKYFLLNFKVYIVMFSSRSRTLENLYFYWNYYI